MYEINYDVIMGMMDQTRKRQLWDNLLDLVMDKAKKKTTTMRSFARPWP